MSDMFEVEGNDLKEQTVNEMKQDNLPTRAELREKGWTVNELDTAEKMGMVNKDVKVENPKADSKEPVIEGKPDEVIQESKQEEKDKEQKVVAPVERKGGVPEFVFKTPEQEKAWLDAFGPGTPQRGLYFRMKNERQARQAIEAERDALKLRIAEYESVAKTKQKDDLESLLSDDVPNKEDEKPLTMKQLRELMEQNQAELVKQKREESERSAKIQEAHRSHEEYARTVYEDFDQAVELAREVIKDTEGLVPERWRQAKVLKLQEEMLDAARNADKLGLDDLNAAHMAYEIAQYHPDYGKQKRKPEQANGGLTPETMKRIEKNAQRRSSSASVSTGSVPRTMSYEDIGLKELAGMSSAERWRFREKYPDRYEKIVTGA